MGCFCGIKLIHAKTLGDNFVEDFNWLNPNLKGIRVESKQNWRNVLWLYAS